MFEQAERTIEFVGQQPPEAFIGALLLALVIALTAVGTYRWLAGRKPDAVLLVCVVLLANLACTLAAVGIVQSTVPTIRLIERGGWPRRDRIINLYDHVAIRDGSRAYIGMTGQDKVAVVDLGKLEVVSGLETGEGPDGMAWVGGPVAASD
jgi:hypothetical protein